MPGPKPDDTYNPVPSVEPTTGAPNDYLSVRANPNSFGAQVGQATEKLGSTMGQVGNDAAGIATQQLGLANEHAANQAEMQLAVQGGEIYDKYKSLTGLDASTAKDGFVQQYLQKSQDIRNSLGNPAAQRAYDALATRRLSFTIQDMNSYSADQRKKAYATGNDDAIKVSTDRLSRVDVAADPKQFGFEMGTQVFNLNAKFTAPEYGKYQNVSATTNKDGTLKFDNSDEGRIAQSDYDNNLNIIRGQAYETATKTIAFDLTGKGGFDKAFNFMQVNKNNMPASTFAKLTQELHGPYQNEIARQGTEDLLSQAHAGFNQELGKGVTSTGTDNLVNVFQAQESSNGKTSSNLGQIQPGTWKQYAKPGEDSNNAKDNTAVTKRILDDLSSKYGGDADRIAVAYFSGPGNVAPEGSANPWINDLKDSTGKSVSSYVSDIGDRLGVSGSGFKTLPSYLGEHESDLIQQARDTARDKYHLDTTGQDLFAQRMETRINEAQSAQRNEVHYLRESILGKATDPKNPMTNPTMLDNSGDPDLRTQWLKLQTEDPYSALLVRNIISANAQGKSKTYGTDFSTWQDQVLSGKIIDASALGPYVGGDKSPISASGYQALSQQIEEMKTPEGQAFAQAEKKFFDSAKGLITGSSLYPGLGGARQDVYQKFLMEKIPQINAAKAAGKNASQIFGDQKSPDYIGKDLVHYQPKEAELTAMVTQQALGDLGRANQNQNSGAASMTFNALPDLQKAVQEKKISKAEATKIGLKNGWISPPAPPVPLPFQGE